MDLPNKRYKIIYADPPWEYEFSHTRVRAINDYPTMGKDDICNLGIKNIADDNSVLLLWVTFPKLDQFLDVMSAWGFKYVTNAFTWIKTNYEDNKPFWGMGYYTRSNAEICLLGKRGDGIQAKNHSTHSVIFHRIMQHSKKPPLIRNKIVELFGDLPRIELFSREKIEGWDAWGNQVPNHCQKLLTKEDA